MQKRNRLQNVPPCRVCDTSEKREGQRVGGGGRGGEMERRGGEKFEG